eukprot:COSAG06_NODE_14698_length_1134_cov_1.253140_1_plen_230_part_10
MEPEPETAAPEPEPEALLMREPTSWNAAPWLLRKRRIAPCVVYGRAVAGLWPVWTAAWMLLRLTCSGWIMAAPGWFATAGVIWFVMCVLAMFLWVVFRWIDALAAAAVSLGQSPISQIEPEPEPEAATLEPEPEAGDPQREATEPQRAAAAAEVVAHDEDHEEGVPPAAATECHVPEVSHGGGGEAGEQDAEAAYDEYTRDGISLAGLLWFVAQHAVDAAASTSRVCQTK